MRQPSLPTRQLRHRPTSSHHSHPRLLELNMTYQVALLNFEGPLDLLLQLVERADLPASELSLTDLTEQYLRYSGALAALDPVEAVGFTGLASKLLYLKSLALLPVAEEPAEEVAELQAQLAAYKHYRSAATTLAAALAGGRRSWGRAVAAQPRQSAPPPNAAPAALLQALVAVQAKAATPNHHRVARPTISLAEMTGRLQQAAAGGAATLQGFFEHLEDRVEVVVAFLAALELWRSGALQLAQDGQFKVIRLADA